MNLWDWLKTAGIFVFIMICLFVFFDWLNYRDLQRRLRKEREAEKSIRIWHGEYITGIALYDIDACVPVVVSDSSVPGETLLIAPVFFDPEMVRLTNLEEEA